MLYFLKFLFGLYIVLLCFGPASALPTTVRRVRTTALRRDDGQLAGPMHFTTSQTSNTVAGLVTQSCVISLTPETVNGEDVVVEVRTCMLSMSGSNVGGAGADGSNTPPPSSGDNTPLASGTSTDTAIASPTTTTSTSPTGTVIPSPTSSGSVSASSSLSSPASGTASPSASVPLSSSASSSTVTSSGIAVAPATSVNSVSSATPSPDPATPSVSTAVPTSSADSAPTLTASNGSPSSSSATEAAASVQTSATATAAASDQATSQAAFSLPGKKLSVLPIGLGVFAGISVIALIVVGLVTYERTKYRKAFRQRKLAEAGANMAYGGMAQRT